MNALRIGNIHVHPVTQEQALERIEGLVRGKGGGYVVTPNVDHVVLAETHAGLREAYAGASLSLADGMPLLWIARLLGRPLPAKVSGSDLLRPLLGRARDKELIVYFLGGAPGVGERARDVLVGELPGLRIVGVAAPPLGFENDTQACEQALAAVRKAQPDLVVVALGCPKQELFMRRHAAALAPAVLLGLGGTLDFVAGHKRRAPRFLSEHGLEWAFRLLQEPLRLAPRYLGRDRAIFGIVWRMLRASPG